MEALTKAELIEALFQRTRFNRRWCDRIVDRMFDAIRETLADGESVMISGFGKFTVRKKM
jgi:integration host factor subunit alpha